MDEEQLLDPNAGKPAEDKRKKYGQVGTGGESEKRVSRERQLWGLAGREALHRLLHRRRQSTPEPLHERSCTCLHLLCAQQVQVKPGLGADPSAASFSGSRFGRSSSYGSFGGYGGGGYAAALAHRQRAGSFGGSPGFVRGGALVPSSDGAGMEMRPSLGSAAAQVVGAAGVWGRTAGLKQSWGSATAFLPAMELPGAPAILCVPGSLASNGAKTGSAGSAQLPLTSTDHNLPIPASAGPVRRGGRHSFLWLPPALPVRTAVSLPGGQAVMNRCIVAAGMQCSVFAGLQPEL